MLTPALQDSLHAMLTWFLEPRSAILDQEGEHRPGAVASLIAGVYRDLQVPRSNAAAITKRPPLMAAADYRGRDGDYGGRVAALCDYLVSELGPWLSAAYLHGSLATHDYAIGWSDVDTLLVVRGDVASDQHALVELRRRCLHAWPLFLRICPLQHHGFIVVTEHDLGAYPSHYLPPVVLDAAVALLPPSTTFHLRETPSSAAHSLRERRDAVRAAVETGTLKHHPKDGVYLQSGYRNAQNGMLQLFSLLGYLMTVPAYVLDAIGQPCQKRESFARARPLFSASASAVIDRASAVRAAWPLREGTAYAGNAIPDWIRPILGERYFEDALLLLDEAVAIVERHRS